MKDEKLDEILTKQTEKDKSAGTSKTSKAAGKDQTVEKEKSGKKSTNAAKGGKTKTVKGKKRKINKVLPTREGCYHSPVINMTGEMQGDESKALRAGLKMFNLPKIDLNDPDAVAERLELFFRAYAEEELKPVVSGLGLALNVDKDWLYAVAYDTVAQDHAPVQLSRECREVIKKAYKLMESMWEENMVGGKIHPVAGIFLGKNHFRYKDKVEHVVSPGNPDSDIDSEGIRQRYLDDPDTVDSEIIDSETVDSDN